MQSQLISIFRKNVFCIDGRSPDNLTNNVIIANPTDEISINIIPFTMLFNMYTPNFSLTSETPHITQVSTTLKESSSVQA